MTEKQRVYLSAAAVIFVNETRDPDIIATRLKANAKRGVSARSLERWRADNREYWREQLTAFGWDVEKDGDNFSRDTGEAPGRKSADYERARDVLNQMPERFTKRQRVKSLKTLMPGFYRTTYPHWVDQWEKENSEGDASDATVSS